MLFYHVFAHFGRMDRTTNHIGAGLCLIACIVACPSTPAHGISVAEVKATGVLRHLGIPYAHFITGADDGMDMELIQGFAARLGVKYEFVKTDWGRIFGDLTGQTVVPGGDDITLGERVPVRGDVAASGITVLPWRQKAVDFSIPTFPNQVWLMARGESESVPIYPTGEIGKDIELTRQLLTKKTVLSKTGTCLDHSLYRITDTGAKVRPFSGGLNEMAPALLNREADFSLLDVPDALVALGKWPGQIKVIGPISERQEMAVAFAKESQELREEFNRYLKDSVRNGSFMKLVRKYYPYVLDYYPDFFNGLGVDR